jgi:hypothetical protein
VGDVTVHRNSAKPAQLSAAAYAQGNEIHLGPGQERHLPHEAWHVVQQRQGRVKPTMQMSQGVMVNDERHLEREADVMGARALTQSASTTSQSVQRALPMQRVAQLTTIIHNDTQTIKQSYNNAPDDTAVVGRRMVAKLDPDDPKKGSAPGSGGEFEIYNELNAAHKKQYIKGHMLNANLGGLGLTENLFPITADANHEHSASVEENVKEAVIYARGIFTKNKLYDVHYTVDAVIDGDANAFVNKPNAHFDCEAKKVFPDKREESIVKRTIYSKSDDLFSKNTLLEGEGWGSKGSGYGSNLSGKVAEVDDPTAIKKELKNAGINITGGTVNKIIMRSGKFHSIIFD